MTNINACESCQAPVAYKEDTSRHLDHLIDIQDGGDFTAVPNALMRAFFDGLIQPSKFKLICIMLSHSSKFKIKRSYLDHRFGQDTLKRYLTEIEKEGYVRREKVMRPSGGYEWIYHTNRLSEWQVPKHSDNDPPAQEYRPSCTAPVQEAPEQEAPVQEGLKKNKEKEIKETNSTGGRNLEQDQCLPPIDDDDRLSDSKFMAKQFQQLYPKGRGYLLEKDFDRFNAVMHREAKKRGIEVVADVILDHAKWMMNRRYPDLTVNELLMAFYRWDESRKSKQLPCDIGEARSEPSISEILP